MADIFEGLKKLSEDDIRLQIAILKNVNLINSFVESSSRAVNRLIGAAGSFLSVFTGSDKNDDSEVINVRIIKVKDRISQSMKELSECDRDELIEILKKELINKLYVDTERDTSEVSMEKIHVDVVRRAAEAYNIDIRQPVALVSDTVVERFYDAFVKSMHMRLIRASEEDKKEIDGRFMLVTRKVDIERLRELNRELSLREFNPKSIMNAVRTDRTTYTLERVIRACGFDAFDYQGCLIGMIIEGVKSLITSERILFANLVWVAGCAYGRKFAVNSDTLPSFIGQGRNNGSNEVDMKFLESVKNAEGIEKKMKKLLSDITDNNKLSVMLENDLLVARSEFDNCLFEYEDIKTQYDEANTLYERQEKYLADYLRLHPVNDGTNMDLKKIKNDCSLALSKQRTLKQKLEKSESVLDKKRIKVEDTKKSLSECEIRSKKLGDDLYQVTNEYNEIVFYVENEVEYRASYIDHKWKKSFSTLHFDTNVIEKVVKLFSKAEMMSIEYALYELNEAMDMKAYANEITKDDNVITGCVIYCGVSAGKYATIRYNDKNINMIYIKE